MSEPTDPNFNWLINHLWVPFVAALGFLGKGAMAMVVGRIEKIEHKADNALPKDDFKEYAERAEIARKELRDGIIGVYKAVDEIKTILIKK